MTKPNDLKCAAPECRSRARDGHVCGYHQGTLYADRTFDARRFIVIATDPAREWLSCTFVVRALSREQAKGAVRDELAVLRRDDWSLTCEERQAAA